LFGQDGWILASIFFCVFMDRGRVEVHKHAEKERGQHPAILAAYIYTYKRKQPKIATIIERLDTKTAKQILSTGSADSAHSFQW